MIQDERIGSEKRGHGPVEGGRFDGVNPTLQWERWTYQGADMYRMHAGYSEQVRKTLDNSWVFHPAPLLELTLQE